MVIDLKRNTLTVSQFLDSVNLVLSSGAPVIVGEVTEFKLGSKWISFTLKDKEDGSILKCVLGAWDYRRIGVNIEDGMEIKVGGTPRVTKTYGSFGFWVNSIEPVGQGSLKKSYEILLKKLEGEGLFARKRDVPEFIKNIGVISSKDGVVIHDFLKNLKPLGFKIKFYNSKVEGFGAVDSILKGIESLTKDKDLDVLVIIRGGGSLESMQAFNNEEVCRQIFSFPIPVVCGIGHDVDVPIACMVADKSVSTPTATAFLINDSWKKLFDGLPMWQMKLNHEFEILITNFSNRIDSSYFKINSAFEKIFDKFYFLETQFNGRLSHLKSMIERCKDKIFSMERILKANDPIKNLSLGYSLVFDSAGKLLKNIKDVRMGSRLEIKINGGEINSVVESVKVK